MNTGLRIRHLAEERKISVKELAGKIGRTRQAVYDIYSGRVSVNVELLTKICKALDIEPYEFFLEGKNPGRSKEELLNFMNKIFGYIIEKNYVHRMHIQQLMSNIHSKSSYGDGLACLSYNNEGKNYEYPFKEEYRPMKNKLTEEDLRNFSTVVYSKYFGNIKEWLDTMKYQEIISQYVEKYFENEEIKELSPK